MEQIWQPMDLTPPRPVGERRHVIHITYICGDGCGRRRPPGQLSGGGADGRSGLAGDGAENVCETASRTR